MRCITRLSILIPLILLVLAAHLFARSAHAQNERCFDETGQCITGRFLTYWEQNGGLAVFGYPITDMHSELNRDDGQTYVTQWFERNRFELHPEHAPPYDVLLGRLGNDRLLQQGMNWLAAPRESGPKPGCVWFAETGHNVCDQGNALGFKTYWQQHGLQDPRMNSYQRSLALFGLPLTAATMEVNPDDGKSYLTQWFERARFEWHPAEPDQYKVLLGLLGREMWGACNAPPAASKGKVRFDVVEDALCITWDDDYSDERGFRIVLEYGVSGERFTYEVPANTTRFIVPKADTPKSGRHRCDRTSFSITVYALRPQGDAVVGSVAIDVECPLRRSALLRSTIFHVTIASMCRLAAPTPQLHPCNALTLAL